MGFFLLLGGALLTFLALYTKYADETEPSKPIIFSSMKGRQWVEKCVEQHPETLWLADANVRKTEEGKATLQETYSEQLFGQKYIEFDRTIMTIQCLKLILDGSDEAYSAFTAAQPEEAKLSLGSFQTLHLQGERLLKSKWEGMSELQMAQAMETALVLGDIGKSEKGRDLFKPYDIKAPDHDDFYGEAIQVLVQHPKLCPSFAKLSTSAKNLLAEIANLAHYGHVTHLEGGLGMFSKLKESSIPFKDPLALSFDLFVHTCDVAGALGYVNNHSSLVYTEPVHQALQAMGDAVRVLSNPHKNELDAYNAYLNVRASWLGLDSENSSDRVLTRIGAMLRLVTLEDGTVLRKSMLELDTSMRDRIAAQLDIQQKDQPSRTPTYMPAVLVNLSNNSQLGRTKEERLSKAITIGLPFIARVLEAHKELMAKGKIDPNIPLNFNKIAGVAKASPSLLTKEFYIDEEGYVYLISDLSTTLSPYGEIEAVIFDCDGVLVDTEYLKFLAWQDALSSEGISFTIEEYMPVVGHSSKNILLMLKKLKNSDIPEKVIELKNTRYRILQKQGVPSIKEMIAFAKYFAEEKQNLGIKLGLASSAPTNEILQNLEQIGLKNSFDLIISGSDDLENYIDMEGKNKPKPYIYIEAAKRLNVSPSRCLVFEDTNAGIESAATAGMIAIAVPNQFTTQQDFSKAAKIIYSYKDLPTKELFKD